MAAVRSRKGKTIRNTLLHLVLAAGSLVMLLPFFWMVSTSLKPIFEVLTLQIKWWPTHPLWENYSQVWTMLPFGRYFLNSLFVAVIVTAVVLITSSLAGYAFARFQFPGRNLLFLLYLGALMVPGEVTIVPTFILMKYLGWIDTYQGLIVPQMFSVFGTFMMRQCFLSIPDDLENAAKIDGCGPFRIFSTIALPLVRPTLAALGIFSFLGTWNNFLWPLIITNKDALRTIPVGLVSFQGQFTTNWPVLMAAAASALVPILIVYILAQKHFIKGIMSSGMGGQ
ncbi:MAG: carbohydrate ABC transporter permease [Tumebacillaceae bacterium]